MCSLSCHKCESGAPQVCRQGLQECFLTENYKFHECMKINFSKGAQEMTLYKCLRYAWPIRNTGKEKINKAGPVVKVH